MAGKIKPKNKIISPLWVALVLLVLAASMLAYTNFRPTKCNLPSSSARYTSQIFGGISGDEILIDRSFMPAGAYENPPFPRFYNAADVKVYTSKCKEIPTDKLEPGSKIMLGFDEDTAVDYSDSTQDTIPVKVIQLEN